MPFGDRTGPLGEGPMTGRGAGYCTGNGVPGYLNRGFGRFAHFRRGFGRFFGYGMGRGRGFRHMYYLTGLPGWARYGYFPYQGEVDEKKVLEDEAKALENELKLIRERLDKLEKEEK